MRKPTTKATSELFSHEEPPISGLGRRTAPDRREVSLRWLGGTFLTGITSTTLMGVALFAALDGKQLLATPPEVAQANTSSTRDIELEVGKEARLTTIVAPTIIEQPTDRRQMSVSTVTQVGDANVVRTRPFEHLRISLANASSVDENYPAFNPLGIFADNEDPVIQDSGLSGSAIYGANVETEAAIKIVDTWLPEDFADTRFVIDVNEAEQAVRESAALLTDGAVQVASLHFVDPLRFGIDDPALASIAASASPATIVPQNVTVTAGELIEDEPSYKEDIIEVRSDISIADALQSVDYDLTAPMTSALSTLLNSKEARPGQTFRLGLVKENNDENWWITRASVYEDNEHRLTIALNDQNQYVPAPEPVDRGVMARRINSTLPQVTARPVTGDLPSAYDAIYRGVLSYELPQDLAAQIVRMVAADVDFRSKIKPDDALELFYSVPEEGEAASANRDVLFVKARFNGTERRFYKFRTEDGAVDYYDEEGRSARQFMLRNPVPNGTFRSGYGMRRHPILKYSKMHNGVDWSAPHGTPIISPANGTVEKAGWAGGYGKQIVLRHANGYETSYSHQTRFAKGITPGARVRQGQVIGFIGTTGLSTGPHLHYEMKVNGQRVDPMRVRLPRGKELTGNALLEFKIERDRINSLLESGGNEQIAGIFN